MVHIRRIDEMQADGLDNKSRGQMSTMTSWDSGELFARYIKFFTRPDATTKQNFIDLMKRTYGWVDASSDMRYNEMIRLDGKAFYPIVMFDGNDVNYKCKDALGETRRYAIAMDCETHEVYIVSYNLKNQHRWGEGCKELDAIKFPFMNIYPSTYWIESCIFLEMFRELGGGDTYGKDGKDTWMVIQGEWSGCRTIHGNSYGDIFREFHDNVNRHYDAWRPHLDVWKIHSPKLESEYNKWVKGAKDIKSGFELFYGNATID